MHEPNSNLGENQDPIDQIPRPKVSAWLGMVLLFLVVLAYQLIWIKLLGG